MKLIIRVLPVFTANYKETEKKSQMWCGRKKIITSDQT
jgi:hypothetical protein